MNAVEVAQLDSLDPGKPAYALVANVDLVVIRWPDDEDQVSVLYGRCQHRGALMSDGHIRGNSLICSLHNWDYEYKTGISAYNNKEKLHRFESWIENGRVLVDEEEIAAWEKANPQPWQRDQYQGLYADPHGSPLEPNVSYIQSLAKNGLQNKAGGGRMAAMGVPLGQLPLWADIQFLAAQIHPAPQLDGVDVETRVIIGPNAKRPLEIDIPLFVSDMSYGALSEEAKTALSMGAELAGTGICSGEGGMLPEEQASNSRYFYELASGRFGFAMDKVKKCQAFHFKFGQGAKTGTGGHLPGSKVTGKIAEVRGLKPGTESISPSRFTDWDELYQFRDFADQVREATGGIPIGAKMSAQHIERDIDAALEIGVDYIILDGRGGGTGAAPLIFRDNISVPTIPALARARRHLDKAGRKDISLIITGGLRLPEDFAKALALGADAIAVSNAAIQSIGCLGMRACDSDNCPVGIATQNPRLRERMDVQIAAQRLCNFFTAANDLICVLARACGHTRVQEFNLEDLTTWKRDMAHLAGVPYGGVSLD